MVNESQIEPASVFTPVPSIFFTLGELLEGDDNEFVGNAYWAMLGRAADYDGLGIYKVRLSEGMSRIDMLHQLRRSPEGQAHGAHIRGLDAAKTVEELLANDDCAFVCCAYQTLLIRPVDHGALKHYIAALRDGLDRLQVLNELRRSEEFQSRSVIARDLEQFAKSGDGEIVAVSARAASVDRVEEGAETLPNLPASMEDLMARNNREFVYGLYQIMFGRTADSVGLQNYLQRMASGISRKEVVRGFSTSDERKARIAFFHRLDSVNRDAKARRRPLLGTVAAVRLQQLEQAVATKRIHAMENQIAQMSRSLRVQMQSAQHAPQVHTVQVERTVVLPPERKRTLKLNQLSPLARDIYFQLKNGLAKHSEGDT
jgi:Domain of unknown function (DUF4214)